MSEQTRALRPICDSPAFLKMATHPRGQEPQKARCGYSKYSNWRLSQDSELVNWKQLAECPKCPFSGSAQQLWRNLLLAENVARQRRLARFDFWVLSPSANKTLWIEKRRNVYDDTSQLLFPKERRRFRRLSLEEVLQTVEPSLPYDDERRKWWIGTFTERYLPNSLREVA